MSGSVKTSTPFMTLRREVFGAGAALAVEWSGVQTWPVTMPSGHNAWAEGRGNPLWK